MVASKLAVLEGHVRTLLEGLGEDLSRDGLVDTPMVRFCRSRCGDLNPLSVVMSSLQRRCCAARGEGLRGLGGRLQHFSAKVCT